MVLSNRQKLTIKHLKECENITDPLLIIQHCVTKLQKPRYGTKINGIRLNHSQTRKYNKHHYQVIIDYIAQGNSVEDL